MSNDFWESKRQEAALYVERRRRSDQVFHDAVFHRINAHIEFVEHRRATRQFEPETALDDEENAEDDTTMLADGDDDGLALDFLGEVDADDMKSLDAAVEASTGGSTPAVATTMMVPPAHPSATPITMPSHLIGTVPLAHVDTGVSALMEDLQIDVQSLNEHLLLAEESKTEESTPPRHVREQRVAVKSPEVEKAGNQQQAVAKPPASATAYDPEAVANEMFSWVDGERHPDVMKRKESLRGEQRRRVTKRYGTGVYAEQVNIRKVSKYYTGEGDASSSSDESRNDSDFEPMEDPVDDDADGDVDEEPFSDGELRPDAYSDEYLGEDKRSRKKKQTKVRRRLRQVNPGAKQTTAKQKERPAPPRRKNVVIEIDSDSDDEPPPTKKTTYQEEQKKMSPPLQATGSNLIKLRVSSDDLAALKKSEESRQEVKPTRHVDHTVLTQARSVQPETQKPERQTHVMSAMPHPTDEPVADDDGYETEELVDADESLDQGVDAQADDVELSDAETVDLEQESMQAAATSQLVDAEMGKKVDVSNGGSHSDLQESKRPSPAASSTINGHAVSMLPEGDTVAIDSDAETVVFDEVASQDDIDFGSDSSDDFTGDDEGESAQFFGSRRKKRKEDDEVLLATTKGRQRDATPVKTVRVTDVKTTTPQKPSTNENGKKTSKADQATSSPLKQSPQVGSNGLRKVANINTTTAAKGKYLHSRRAIIALDVNMKPVMKANGGGTHTTVEDPKAKLLQRSRYNTSSIQMAKANYHERISLLTLKRSRSEDSPAPASDSRYLGYNGSAPSKPSSIKSIAAEAARRATERFASPELRMSAQASRSFSLDGAGEGILSRKDEEQGMPKKDYYVPPRDPQMDVYQATGAVSHVGDVHYDTDGGHKRPSQFLRDVEEKKKRGVDVRKGVPEERDPKAKIPKKSRTQLERERTSSRHEPPPVTNGPDRYNSEPVSKKMKKAHGEQNGAGAPSKYGPSAMGPSSSARSKGGEDKRSNGVTGKKRKASSPHSSKSERDHRDRRSRSTDDRRDGGRDRYSRGKDRDRSRDRSQDRSRDRSDDRDYGRSSQYEDRDRTREHKDRPRDSKKERRDSYERDAPRDSPRRRFSEHDDRWEPTSSSRHESTWSARSNDIQSQKSGAKAGSSGVQRPLQSYAEPQKLAESLKQPRVSRMDPAIPAIPGALETFDDDDNYGDDGVGGGDIDSDGDIIDSDQEIPIADDDDDGIDAAPLRDIRVHLDAVEFDEAKRRRMVYVTNIGPQIEERMLEAKLAAFDVDVDADTGFPAIEVFMCQRSHRARGDGRITFVSPEEAQRAASELNRAIFKDCNIVVRTMDPRTMQILTAQFDVPRDTWVCPNAQCHTDVSVWAMFCPSCHARRQFGASNVKISDSDWLCSICYTANDGYASRCNTCAAEVPPVTRGSHGNQRNDRDRSWGQEDRDRDERGRRRY